jgi:hypothetical protein
MALPFQDADDRRGYLETFGERWVYFDGDETREIYGRLSNPFQKVEGSRGPPIASKRPDLLITRDDVAEPKVGDLLFRGELADFVGEFDYEVANPPRQADFEMMVKLSLKEVPS